MSSRVHFIRFAAGMLLICTLSLAATKQSSETHTSTPTESSKEGDSDKSSAAKQDAECSTTAQFFENIECMEQGIENIRQKYDKLSKDKTSDGKPMPVGVEEDFEIEDGLNSIIHRLYQDLNLPPEELKKLESLEKDFFKVPHGAKDTVENEKKILDLIASNLTKQLDEKGVDPGDKKRLALQKAIETKMGYNNLKKNSAKGSETTYIGYGKPGDQPRIESIPIKPAKPEEDQAKLRNKASNSTQGIGNMLGAAAGSLFGIGPSLGSAAGGALANLLPGTPESVVPPANPSTIGPTLDRPFGLNLFPNQPQTPTKTDGASDNTNSNNNVAPKAHGVSPVEEANTEPTTDKNEAPSTKDVGTTTAAASNENPPTQNSTSIPNSNTTPSGAKTGGTSTGTPSAVATGTPPSSSQGTSSGTTSTASAGIGANTSTGSGPTSSSPFQGMQDMLGSIRQFFSPNNSSGGRHADDSVTDINSSKDSSSLTQDDKGKQNLNQLGNTGSVNPPGYDSSIPSYNYTNTPAAFSAPQTTNRVFDAGFFNSNPLEVKDLNNVTALKVGQLPGMGDIDTPLPGSLKTDIIETPGGAGGDVSVRSARTLAAIPTTQTIGSNTPVVFPQDNQYTTPVVSRRSNSFGRSISAKAPTPLTSESANNTVDYEPAVATKTEVRRPKKSGPPNPDDFFNDEVVVSPTDTKLLAKLRELNNVAIGPVEQRELALLEPRVLTTDKDFLETSGLPKTGEVQDDTTLQSGVLLPSLAPFASSFETLGLKPTANMLPKPATRLIEQLSKDFEKSLNPLTTQSK